MNNTFRNVFASAALALVAAGSASAGVFTTDNNVTYTATVSDNILNLTIDAAENDWNAKELDILAFTMVGLDKVTLVSAPTSGWVYSFESGAKAKDKDTATFTANAANQTFLTEPLQFSFAFTGTDLNFDKLGLKASYLANGKQSDSISALQVTAVDAGADVPEPASAALLLGGLGLMGALRRKARRG